jgi:hypothetical protein
VAKLFPVPGSEEERGLDILEHFVLVVYTSNIKNEEKVVMVMAEQHVIGPLFLALSRVCLQDATRPCFRRTVVGRQQQQLFRQLFSPSLSSVIL